MGPFGPPVFTTRSKDTFGWSERHTVVPPSNLRYYRSTVVPLSTCRYYRTSTEQHMLNRYGSSANQETVLPQGGSFASTTPVLPIVLRKHRLHSLQLKLQNTFANLMLNANKGSKWDSQQVAKHICQLLESHHKE